jgi:hypothetical protein
MREFEQKLIDVDQLLIDGTPWANAITELDSYIDFAQSSAPNPAQ